MMKLRSSNPFNGGQLRLAATVIIPTVLIFGVWALAADAAPSAEQLRQRVAEAEVEAAELREGLASARERMFEAETAAELAASRLARVEDRLAKGARRSATLAELVDSSTERLTRERKRLKRAQDRLADRLVAIYIAGPARAGDVAIGVEDFDALLAGTRYLTAIEQADGRLAERVEQVRGRVAAESRRLANELAAAERHEEALAAARDRIGSISAAADARAASLRQAAAERDAMLSELLTQMEGWAEQVERAERRERRRAQSSGSGTSTVERWLGGPYSIPTAIVMCESGGNYSALNPTSGAGGAYQIIPSTWAAYGGKGLPHEAPKAEQDRIAAQIWADSGPNAWVCKS